MRQKFFAIFVIMLFVLSPISIAQGDDLTTTEPVVDTIEYISYDDFYENPSLVNWNQLSYSDQLSYYSDFSNVGQNPEIDTEYFSDVANIGQNPEADDSFFTGAYSDDPISAGRENFQSYSKSASAYIQNTFSLDFEVTFPDGETEELADDFVFNKDDGTLTNNGKTITLSQFESDDNVKSIQTTQDGFVIVRGDVEEISETITITGDETQNIIYDGDDIYLLDQDNNPQFTFSLEKDFLLDKDVSFDFDNDGNVKITGPVKGDLEVEGELYQFDNHIGTLEFFSNGDINAENSEIITRTLYADGSFEKDGNTITARDHGNNRADYNNLFDSQTVIIDRTTGVGVRTQGQNPPDEVTINIDHDISEFPDFSAFKEAPPREKQTLEDVRAQARDVKAVTKPSLGKSAEVWIGTDDTTGEVVVTAKGRANVGFYNTNSNGVVSLKETEPQFTGKDGLSEFDIKVGGVKDDIAVRGQAVYSDGQYSKIDTTQEGSTFKIQRPVGSQQDAIVFDCIDCEAGSAITIDKTLLASQVVSEDYNLYEHLDSGTLSISVTVNEDGTMSYTPPVEQLGNLAQLQANGATVSMGRELVMKSYCAKDIECNFQMYVDGAGRSQMISETIDVSNPNEPTLIQQQKIDPGILEFSGKKIIVASDAEIENALAVLDALNKGDFNAVSAEAGGVTNSEIRDLVLDETYFDVSLVGNEDYMASIEAAVEKRIEFQDFKDKVENDYGILLDDSGNCVSGPDECAKIDAAFRNQLGLAWYWSAARISAMEAEDEMLQAQVESGLVEADDAAKQIRENKQVINQLSTARNNLNRQVNERQQREAIANGEFNNKAKQDFNKAASSAQKVEDLRARNVEIEKNIAFFEGEIDSVWVAGGVKDGYRREIDLLKSELSQNEQLISGEQSFVTSTAAQYAADRPDLAAEICAAGANSQCAFDYVEQTASIDTDRALMIATQVSLLDKDLASAAKYQSQIDDETLSQQMQGDVWNLALEQSQERYQESQALVSEKREETIQGLEGAIEFLSYVSKVGSAVNLLQLAPGEQDSLIEAYYGTDEETTAGRLGGYKGAALSELENERNGRLYVNQLLKGYSKLGVSVGQAYNLMEVGVTPSAYQQYVEDNGQLPTEVSITDYEDQFRGYRLTTSDLDVETLGAFYSQTGSASFKNSLKESNGQQLTVDDLAAGEKENIELQIAYHETNTAPVKNDLVNFANTYSESDQADWANSELDYLDEWVGIAKRSTIETYGEVAEEFTLVDEVIPVGLVLKGGKIAAKGTKLLIYTEKAVEGTKALKTIEAGVEAEKVAAASSKLKAVEEFVSPVTNFLNKERYVSSEGRLLSKEAQLAREELEVAKLSDNAAEIAKAAEYVSETEKQLEVWKTASSTSTNVFTKEIGLTSQSRQALAEQQAAVKAFNEVSKTEGVATAVAMHGDEVLEASKAVEKASLSASLTSKAEKIFSSGSDEAVKIADDIGTLAKNDALLTANTAADGTRTIGVDTSLTSTASKAEVEAAAEDFVKTISRETDETTFANEATTTLDDVVEEAAASQRATAQQIQAENIAQLSGEGETVLPAVQSQEQAVQAAAKPKKTSSQLTAEAIIADETPTQAVMSSHLTQSDVGLQTQAVYSDNLVTSLSQGEEVQVATLDGQKFKEIFNTPYGHDGGDIALKEMGGELSDTLSRRGVKVTHKSGKTFKATCVNCDEDLAVIIAQEMDGIRARTVKKIKAVDPNIDVPVERFNYYVGVSERTKFNPKGTSIDEATDLANELNTQSLRNGKYGQLRYCGKNGDCTNIVRQGENDAEMIELGIRQAPDNFESEVIEEIYQIDSGVENVDLGDAVTLFEIKKIENEFYFFGEDLKYSNIDGSLQERQLALESQDLTRLREIDNELMHADMRRSDGIYYGNENMKSYVNSLISNPTSVDTRRVFVVGGDELSMVIHREDGITSLVRVDINFFGTTNLQHGVPAADIMKDDALRIMQEVLEDSKIGIVEDTDEAIGAEIVKRFNEKMIEDGITIVGDVEGTEIITRPSLSLGFADNSGQIGEDIAFVMGEGDLNGASVLNKAANSAAEEQKVLGKRKLLEQTGDIKEVIPEDFVKKVEISEADFEAIYKEGSYKPDTKDNLVAEFIKNDGNLELDEAYQAAKNPSTAEEAVDKTITGVGFKIEGSADVVKESSFVEAGDVTLSGVSVSDDVVTTTTTTTSTTTSPTTTSSLTDDFDPLEAYLQEEATVASRLESDSEVFDEAIDYFIERGGFEDDDFGIDTILKTETDELIETEVRSSANIEGIVNDELATVSDTAVREDFTYVIYDNSGIVDEEKTREFFEQGVRSFTTPEGEEVAIRTDDIVESIFDFCRQLGVKCGVAGSDTYRSLRLRKPTNTEKLSDFDIIVPSDEELSAIGYRGIGRGGVSVEEAERVLGKDWLDSFDYFSPEQVQWAYDLQLRYERKGVNDIFLDLVGKGGEIRPEITRLPGATSRKLILQSDGVVVGSEQAIDDALEGILRLDNQPLEIRQPLRMVRFATEEQGIVFDATTQEALAKYVNELFVEGTATVYHPTYGRTNRNQLIEQLGEVNGEVAFQQALYNHALFGDLTKNLGKVYENSVDAYRSVEVMDDIGLSQHLIDRGIDVNGLARLVEDAKASGTSVSHTDIHYVIDSKLEIPEDLPYTITSQEEYVSSLTGGKSIPAEILDETINANLDFVTTWNSGSIQAKSDLHAWGGGMIKELTQPLSNFDLSKAKLQTRSLAEKLGVVDEVGEVKPEFTESSLTEIFESSSRSVAIGE